MTQNIHTLWERMRLIISGVGAYIAAFLGGADGLLIALVSMMALDYISGVISALVNRQLSSDIGFKGICKKALILMLVGAASVIDLRLNAGNALRGAVICFYISNEALSLIENAAKMGLPIPEKLKQALEQLKDKE